jgi:hypothetical protein
MELGMGWGLSKGGVGMHAGGGWDLFLPLPKLFTENSASTEVIFMTVKYTEWLSVQLQGKNHSFRGRIFK